MTPGELAYLGLVLASIGVFSATLLWLSVGRAGSAR
jgi:hypothetical protein